MTMKSFTDMELPDMTDAYRQVQEKNLDSVNPVAVKKKFKDRKDQDVDNDGDVDDSDKYLHKKRKAISKAVTKEHHEKDEYGNTKQHDNIPVEDDVKEEKKGLYANIHAKRARGESPAKPGDKDYPAKDAFKKAAKTAKKEEVEVADESMKQARKNVGASTCWDGYKAKGTKMKGGKKVPNCVKEFSEWRRISEKK